MFRLLNFQLVYVFRIFLIFLFLWSSIPVYGSNRSQWTHLSSSTGNIPTPANNNGQAALQILDVNKDGTNDFVIALWNSDESLAWYRRSATGWSKYLIDLNTNLLEAGGTFYDVDQDGDMDVVFGDSYNGNNIYWWQNPYPVFDVNTPWNRFIIKQSGGNKHHDMMFGDFDSDGKDEFLSWNQGPGKLLLFEIPDTPESSGPWLYRTIYSYTDSTGDPNMQHEGLAKTDINLDGKIDIVGAGFWFEHIDNGTFLTHIIDQDAKFTRAAAGQLKKWGYPEVIFAPGDSDGPVYWYEKKCDSWQKHLLLEHTIHAHSLEVMDIDHDGNLDIFLAEMGEWGFFDGIANNPQAKIRIFYGDGNGNFFEQIISTGQGVHEAKIADLDADGDLDILGKPFGHNIPRLDIWLNESKVLSLNQWDRKVIEDDLPWRTIFVESGDLDNDELPDIITGAWWYKNPGNLADNWQRNTIGLPLNNMAEVFDFDNDGDLDILGTQGQGAASNNNFIWAQNDGLGNFTILSNIPDGTDGDFLQGTAINFFGPNKTGLIKIVLSWHNGANGIQMLTVPQNPVISPWIIDTISPVTQNEALSAADIGADGNIDLLLGTKWLRNDITAYIPFTLFSTSQKPDRNRLANINNDGRFDAVVGYEAVNTIGKLAWYQQPANPADYWPENIIANLTGPMSLDVADMDKDGDLDVIVGEHNTIAPSTARLFIFQNADGSGNTWIPHLVHTGDEHHDGAHVVDIDNDGDLDIVSIGWVNDKVVLYENLANSAPQDSNTRTIAINIFGDGSVEKTADSCICDANHILSPSADFDGDCKVDFSDYACLSAHWLNSGSCLPCDLDTNYIIDANDFLLFTSQWLYTSKPEICKDPARTEYPFGDTVQLTAIPAWNWIFANWTGDIDSNSNSLNFIMTQNYTLTANFVYDGIQGPNIIDIYATPTAGYATIYCRTDIPSTATLYCGLSPSYESGLIESPILQTEHTLILTSLIPATQYHYQLICHDQNANQTSSGDLTFSTKAVWYDYFDNAQLNENIWTFINPLQDSHIFFDANTLSIFVPAGLSHDIEDLQNKAPRLMQAVPDTNFEIEAKFNSEVNLMYQMQGLIIEQDSANFLRLDIHSDGANTKLYAATYTNGVTSVKQYQTIPKAAPYYLSIFRDANNWTFSYSYNGADWIVAATFQHPVNVTSVGFYAGNHPADQNAPEFTGIVDYFFNSAQPLQKHYIITTNTIGSGNLTKLPDQQKYHLGQTVQLTAIPETGSTFVNWTGDLTGNENPTNITVTGNHTITANFTQADTTPPVISDIQTDPATRWATIFCQTNEPATIILSYGKTTAYELGQVIQPALSTQHSVELMGLTPATSYHYKITAEDSSANQSATEDLTFTTQTGWYDHFDAGLLNENIWTFTNPLSDANLTFDENALYIYVPAGVSHDITAADNKAPRIMHVLESNNFQIEAKFNSDMNLHYQMQGLLIQHDPDNFLRLDVHSDGSNVRLFAAIYSNGSTTVKTNQIIPANAPYYLSIRHLADLWTCHYSKDNLNWNTAASFDWPYSIYSVGIFAANHGSTPDIPPFTAIVDYFFNTDQPVP